MSDKKKDSMKEVGKILLKRTPPTMASLGRFEQMDEAVVRAKYGSAPVYDKVVIFDREFDKAWEELDEETDENEYVTEDAYIRNLLNLSGSNIDASVQETEPTILSLQDTVDLIVKKYGTEWRDYAECKCTVIWASKNFELDHVKEVVPDLYPLCEEYHTKGTVNGKKFADNFALLAFYVIDPNTEKFEK